MTMTSGTPRSRRRGLYGLLAGGLLSASAATLIALPVANAQCDQTVGNSIDSYLKQHPDLHRQLQASKHGSALIIRAEVWACSALADRFLELIMPPGGRRCGGLTRIRQD